MVNKPPSDTKPDPTRRQLLKLAGASVAVGGLGLKVGLAHANSAVAGSSDILDVVIVGAGLAGLTAARDLQHAGLESFAVLEARDRVGGAPLTLMLAVAMYLKWVASGLVQARRQSPIWRGSLTWAPFRPTTKVALW